MKIGLDVGSTTIKCVVLDEESNVIFTRYERHFSHIIESTRTVIDEVIKEFGDIRAHISISGSAGMGMAEKCGIPFVQEVFATRVAAGKYIPDTDVIIELGGEDAKIIFLSNGMEVRMNGSCAGGTGAFIDQMASLLGVTAGELNALAEKSEKIYTVASRCGVFAKTDIQPLLNQGAKKTDVAASIFYAVVNQTIGGLAQGRVIKGKVVYLGGPITFLPELKKAFDNTLNLEGICPENSLFFVAAGAALYSDEELLLSDVYDSLLQYDGDFGFSYNEPLFNSDEEYDDFIKRHSEDKVVRGELTASTGPVHIGIDAGSTTLKCAVVDTDDRLLHSTYQSNSGNPVPQVKEFLETLYEKHPYIEIASVTTTGYGEEIVKKAFNADFGVVETIAHFTAARKFMPEVDFVIDIGGQDMKCFQIKDGVITNIFLNEACSSGCGSFLQTFAEALGKDIKDFSKLGLFAKAPVELGSRCTVFMNSSIKQAQKDGATVDNISAGLSISVVKNALYKVIRSDDPKKLGRHIVVQGGTFLNMAVLRAFEKELDATVKAPDIAGLMGAYGAALYGKSKSRGKSSVMDKKALSEFVHKVKATVCKGCENNCRLTVNTFYGGGRFISGNRCEHPVTNKKMDGELNLYSFKHSLLAKYEPCGGKRGTIGIPMGLNFYETYPFWYTLFTKLGFGVVRSKRSDRKLYLEGQSTIPSDTVCFPAKLMHGHVADLCKMDDVDTIFYPCMTYNINENKGDNHYNCPVVAYYPEVIAASMKETLSGKRFIYDYVGIDRKKDFSKKFTDILSKYFEGITYKEVKSAAKQAYEEYDKFLFRIREKGSEVIKKARENDMLIIVLAGRPYHIDEEVCHGIDTLIEGFNTAILSEEAISHLTEKTKVGVLNQWTYHARLYDAARYVCKNPDMQLVQLISFGCGVDAVTADEVRSILEENGKIYTQVKIDEITNLGAVKIRLRSLLAAIGY
ncbi:MAG TPA: acyl-CoA dehydratase activase [Clostridia bacterium]|nr:acyl-CoA dehydratase activase [Clostridia bacterium]